MSEAKGSLNLAGTIGFAGERESESFYAMFGCLEILIIQTRKLWFKDMSRFRNLHSFVQQP